MRPLTFLAIILVFTSTSIMNAADKPKSKHPIYGKTMQSLSGQPTDLGKFKGKALLIVNTASQCGATPQYAKLQDLHENYGEKGLAVLGFPCNQFGAQEPGSATEIAQFCSANYGVTFDMFAKIDVNGKDAAPLFAYLTSDDSGLEDSGKVNWNFEKFLVSRDGKVLARFRTSVEPDSPEVVKAVEDALKGGS